MAVIRTDRMLEILTSPSVDPNLRRTFVFELTEANRRDDEDDYRFDDDCRCLDCCERREMYEERTSRTESLPRIQIAYDEGREPLTQERANLLLTQLREVVISQGHFGDKVLRPWSFDPTIYSNLDQTAAWWGWEFETGYNTETDRERVVAHTWDTWDGVTFDAEGDGWESEITFIPQEMSKFLDGTADACEFMQYLDSCRDVCETSTNPFVGTHINISFPEFRTEDRQASGYIERVRNGLTYSGLFMEDTPEFRLKHFGRKELYGWFYNNVAWIEGKLFRTTYNYEQFKSYLNTANAFTRVIKAMIAFNRPNMVCVNLTEVLENPDAPVQLREMSQSYSFGYIPGRGEPVIVADASTFRGVEAVRARFERNMSSQVFTYN